MKKNDYLVELIFSTVSFVLTIPLMFLVYMFHNEPCNFQIWTIIIYFIPLIFFMILRSMFPNSTFLNSSLVFNMTYVILQFLINTIALFRLLLKKREKNIEFWLCLGIVLVNYVMMGIFIYTQSNIGGCNL